MSFKHFVMHDMVHGIFHVDKGIFFTIGQIMLRPGQTARAYLAGKRSSYFNLLTLLVLCTALYLYLDHFIIDDDAVDSDIEALLEFLDKYVRWIILSCCFVVGASSFGVFRRAKLNYTEHLILSGFLLVGVLLINSLNNAINIWGSDLDWFFLPLSAVYVGWGYYGAFRSNYTLRGWTGRLLLHYLISAVVLTFILMVAVVAYLKATSFSETPAILNAP